MTPKNTQNGMIKWECVLPQWLRNTLIFPLFFLNGWALFLLIDYLQPMISIVLMSIILAIVLDFPVRFLQRRSLSRGWGLAIVVVVAIGLLPMVGFVVFPLLIQQLSSFLNQLPQWISSADGILQFLDELPLFQVLGINLSQLETQLTSQMITLIRTLGSTLLGLLVGSFSGGLKIFFMIVLTIFMLAKGGKAWAGVMSWLPPWWRDRIETRVPYKFRRFIVGQIAIVEAEAKEKSAEALGNAEVIRAMKLAEANTILGESLRDNEAYLRYLWITQVAAGQQEGDTTVIYLPGQDFLPFSESLETSRAAK